MPALLVTICWTAVVVAPAVASETPILAPLTICIPHVGCTPGQNTLGFGHVKPRTIFLGGDGTGVICRIHWLSWGGEFAIGTGTAADVVGQQDDAHARWSPAVVILSKLGTWHGQPAYFRTRWRFPDGEPAHESAPCAGF
jgi:hypothetical protein